jgi:membrane-bound metal-dependent hydrolase YbcI (DUF457 family)
MIQAALHLLTATLLALLLGPSPVFVLILALCLSLMPDLDTPKSLIGSLIKPVSTAIERRFGHRTATHSIAALCLISAVSFVILPAYWQILAAAYASHLLIDLLIGRSGIMLLWPAPTFLTLTAWRDDGPAPRIMLLLLVPATVLAATWQHYLAPVINSPLQAAVQAVNPIATEQPEATARPSIRLRLALPSQATLSHITVKAGDTIQEGQILAEWPTTTPTTTATPVPIVWPTAAPIPNTPTPLADCTECAQARVALETLQIEHSAKRAALSAEQQRKYAEQQRQLAELQRDFDAAPSQHDLTLLTIQLDIETAEQALELLRSNPEPNPEKLAKAEATLRKLRLKLEQTQATQNNSLEQLQAKRDQAQLELEQMPSQQATTMAVLEQQQQADLLQTSHKLELANNKAEQQQLAHEQAHANIALTTTAIVQQYYEHAQATADAYTAALTATAIAQPEPEPNNIVSRVSGTIIAITVEETDSRLVVNLEIMP